MNSNNVESYLRDNHDRCILLNYRTVKKYYLRIELVKLDIYYLKSCRNKDIIPKFLRFKTANRNLASSFSYKDSQRRLLNAEITYKYQHLNELKKLYRYACNLSEQFCPGDLFDRLQNIITTVCCPVIRKKKQTVDNKLYVHSLYIPQLPVVNREVVKNLSTRILSNAELDCLANGLDFGLVPKRFDEMGTVGNIEQFFHHVTDIFQHHKKFLKDLKDNDKVISNDTRVLNTKELTLASNLRSLTDAFQHQANRYRRRQYMIRGEQKQYHDLLQRLKQDPSIIVTRPDKGRGIVLMDKNDYITKMNAILADSTKFQRLSYDPTLPRQDRLTTLLRKLKNEDLLTKQLYDLARPTGANPGRLYGLPKIHKDGNPLRPVLSSIGTYNYRLAKVLKQMLSVLIKSVTVIKDSFAFIDELKILPESMSKYKMVSFDVTSLYTNIPLNETIELILHHLYELDSPPRSTIKKDDMKKLLESATKRSHFLFNGEIYDQIDGVSMGSPLAPLLAEIFLQDFEKKHQELFKELGIVYWKRYVDDTFVLLDPNVKVEDVCQRLSQCHPAVQFTSEEEREPNEEDLNKWEHLKNKKCKTSILSFLDVLVERDAGGKFQTTIYRKKTFSGLTTKWHSFVPKKYKYSAISSVVYRAIRICSTYEALVEEFDKIRKIFQNNGYPSAFVESVIRRQLNLKYTPRPKNPTATDDDIVVLRVPYYGKPSQIYAKRVIAAVVKQYPLKKVRVVYDVKARIGQNFNTKDIISDGIRSGVVYEATCTSCNDKYIGKTFRNFKTRINEHLYDLKINMSSYVKPPETTSSSNDLPATTDSASDLPATTDSANDLPATTDSANIGITGFVNFMRQISNTQDESEPMNISEISEISSSLSTNTKNKKSKFKTNKIQKKVHNTRSKTKPITKTLQKDDINQTLQNKVPSPQTKCKLKNMSGITRHYITTGHTFEYTDFKILLTENHKYKLLIKESLLIKQRHTALNATVRSLPIYIYPDGLRIKGKRAPNGHTTATTTTNPQLCK